MRAKSVSYNPRLQTLDIRTVTSLNGYPNERSLASILLGKVAAEPEQDHTTGKFLQARVDRCDGHNKREPDKWVIFLSTPYLDSGKFDRDPDADLEFHRPQTLFEFVYKDQDTSLQDEKQMLRTKLRSSDILRVHSLWALFSSGTLVMSSPDPADEMLGPSILMEDVTDQVETGELRIIRLLDPTDRTFFIPLVVGLCARRFGATPEMYHLSDNDGNEITAAEWQQFITNQNDFGTMVRVGLYSSSPPPEAPPPPSSDRDLPPNNDGPRGRDELVVRRREVSLERLRLKRPRRSRRSINIINRARGVTNENGRPPFQRKTGALDEERRLDQHHLPLRHSDDAGTNHIDDYPADYREQTTVLSVLKGGSRGDIADSPSELTESPADEKINVQKQRELRLKEITRRRGTRDTTQPSYPAIDPVRNRSLRSGQRRSHHGDSLALVPYGGPDETAGQLSRDDRALIIKKDVILEEQVNFETWQTQRWKEPKYIIRSIPNTVMSAAAGRDGGRFDHIFYCPKDVLDSLITPAGDSQRSLDTDEKSGTTNKVVEGPEAHRSPSNSQPPLQGEERQSKKPRPAWKKDRNEADKTQRPPPACLPLAYWFCETTIPWDQSGNTGDVRSAPLNDAGRNQMTVLNFVLAQIDSNLTQGNRVQAHRLGEPSEKEAPIYKGLLESSRDAVAERVTSFCGAGPSVKAEDETKPNLDIFTQVRLCFDILVELLESFLPQDYPSVVLRKFWYGVDVWIRGLQQLMSAKDTPPNTTTGTKRRPDPVKAPDIYYVVRADWAPRSSQLTELKYPDRDVDRGTQCINRQSYTRLENVLQHLREVHFTSAMASENDNSRMG
ncbi:uncharacterized protein Z519_08026 [Cladophialophora bantiana CBS 173.52]|uniref:Uncharacterized protein n=1 Tax=Cladophialophora bantiana (strain ATCC 10958 / CBS 173.52 / CDC B-1940 / NIH 8579) TaxID=1442370 RepID=A0A0D2FXB6_CLAB1|nr:uncharacterized protein Z519_08026 [Cladophialophora bantiana CBS 173.52]KIW91132.1 hypothetical protein Z519_08026 [Cladophialophora bantiana CBS 173.52]